ncbi:MAG TPA: EthD family reductase [Bacillota bacterium]
MVKLVALYRRPDDPAEFDRRYFNEHLPLANRMPGLRRVEVSRVVGAPAGEPAYYLMAELYFDDRAALDAAMTSAEGRAAAENLMSFAGQLVRFLIAEVDAP